MWLEHTLTKDFRASGIFRTKISPTLLRFSVATSQPSHRGFHFSSSPALPPQDLQVRSCVKTPGHGPCGPLHGGYCCQMLPQWPWSSSNPNCPQFWVAENPTPAAATLGQKLWEPVWTRAPNHSLRSFLHNTYSYFSLLFSYRNHKIAYQPTPGLFEVPDLFLQTHHIFCLFFMLSQHFKFRRLHRKSVMCQRRICWKPNVKFSTTLWAVVKHSYY